MSEEIKTKTFHGREIPLDSLGVPIYDVVVNPATCACDECSKARDTEFARMLDNVDLLEEVDHGNPYAPCNICGKSGSTGRHPTSFGFKVIELLREWKE